MSQSILIVGSGPAGLTLGYASLSEEDIQLGIRTLAAVVARLERSE